MWGKLANIAEQLDANAAKLGDAVIQNSHTDKLGNDDNDPQNNIKMAPSSDTDYVDEEENGWGGSDGEDLDFDDDEDMYSSGVDTSFDDIQDKEVDGAALDIANPEAVSSAVENEAETTTVKQPQSPPHTFPEIVSVSAPGKALVAGGYLVLESPNPGVVLAADGCRFHTTITFRQPCIG